MASNQTGEKRRITRRATLAGIAGAGTVAVAGCSSSTSSDSSGGDESGGDAESGDGGSESAATSPLESGGSSTVYPIANSAASYWNANRPASDSEYWPHGEYDIDTDNVVDEALV